MQIERIKIEKDRNYTTINNHALKNRRLSLKAKGLFAMIMGLPDSWDFTIAGIVAICQEGTNSIYRTINDLIAEGYCTRKPIRIKGQIRGSQYTFYETPIDPNLSENTAIIDENESLDGPYIENPNMENQSQLNNHKISIPSLESVSQSSTDIDTYDFETQSNAAFEAMRPAVTEEPKQLSPPKVKKVLSEEQRQKRRQRQIDRKNGIYRRNKELIPISKDWWPPESDYEEARLTLDLINVKHHTKNFIDHHIAKGDVQFDWVAKWRIWVRNSQNWAEEKLNKNSNKLPVSGNSLSAQLRAAGLE